MDKLITIILFALALAGWGVVFGGFDKAFLSLGSLGPAWLVVFTISCIAMASMPPVAGPLLRALNRVRSSSPRGRVIRSIAIAFLACGYLLLTAFQQHRQLFPYIHDEFSYLIQAHQLASGHLWMPAHPIGQFFDSFQIFTSPVYASAYFPGTALLYVPGVWLHLQPLVTSILIAGIVAGLLFWITAELIDDVAAFLAILLLMSDAVYRQLSTLTMGQLPLLMYGLLAIVCWLKWRRGDRPVSWLLGMSFCLAMAAITRPVDALCFALPIVFSVIVKNPRQLGWMMIGALPLIVLQLVINHGITQSWLKTPFDLYADRDYPGTRYGFHPVDPSTKPASTLPQKLALYREYESVIAQHRPGNILSDLLKPHGPFNGPRLRLLLSQSSPVPFPLLLPLLPLCLLGLNRARSALLAIVPLMVLLYIPYVFFFPHYVMTAAPAVIVGILLGARSLAITFKSRARLIEVLLTLFIAGSALGALPNWTQARDDMFDAGLIANVNQQLATLVHQPAVVLFTYDPARNTHEEPVYNADVPWPDQASIIRAHDLGKNNQTIFDYYAARDPSRVFYRFDERNRTLTQLGTARDLSVKSVR